MSNLRCIQSLPAGFTMAMGSPHCEALRDWLNAPNSPRFVVEFDSEFGPITLKIDAPQTLPLTSS